MNLCDGKVRHSHPDEKRVDNQSEWGVVDDSNVVARGEKGVDGCGYCSAMSVSKDNDRLKYVVVFDRVTQASQAHGS